MKLPFYLRKNKLRQDKNGKLWLDIRMNNFDQFLCIIDLVWARLQYFRKDDIWPSRRWNWNKSDYIDLSGWEK